MPLTRRQWLASSGLSLLTSCRRAKATGYPGYALIATSGDKSLGVVDLASFSLTPSTGSIHLIDSQLRRTASRRLADVLSEIRITADGKHVVAVSPDTRELIGVDPASLRVL